MSTSKNETASDTPEETPHLTRRAFVQTTAAGLFASAVGKSCWAQNPALQGAPTLFQSAVPLSPVEALTPALTRPWLGKAFWANRFQDWQLNNGWIECLAATARDQGRTVGILTRELLATGQNATLSVVLRKIGGGNGFGGFLIGIGDGQLDYRQAALCQKASGIGGGIFCVFGNDGRVAFHEHLDEQKPLAYAEPPSQEFRAPVGARRALSGEVLLQFRPNQ